MFGSLRLILRIAFRNLFASGINLIIGAIIFFGTLLLVVGSSMLDSLDESMSRSIIGSVAGHIQVYSDKSKDELSLYGDFGGEPDISPMTNYPKVQQALLSLPNVKAVVPMGTSSALISSGNTVDLTLAELRDVIRKEMEQGKTPELTAQEESLKAHVRQIVAVIRGDLKNLQEMTADSEREESAKETLDRASSPEFWRDFDKDPYASLEFLENRIAPQVSDGDLLGIRYVGTDLDAFQKTFDRMEIVDGQRVPTGHRGFLFSKLFYEDYFKLKSARRLDKIKAELDARAMKGRKLLSTDPVLQRYMKENQSQTREIIFQLDALKTQKAVQILQKALGSTKADLEPLLVDFFAMTDENFADRYQIFYRDLAPLLQLYRLRIGDNLTIKSFTRSGYGAAVSVRIWGTYRFKGMGESPLAGAINLMDLMSFRELYGYLSTENLEEIKNIQKESGAKEVDRAHAEDELFADRAPVVVEAQAQHATDLAAGLKGTRNPHTRDDSSQVFDPRTVAQGVVPNAAVLLKDPKLIQETVREIDTLSKREGLGLRTMTWQKASGFLGQMVMVLKGILYLFVTIIFVVAFVIINNAMMMAALQRVREIGTMRAVGAQRGFILNMILTETVVLGLVFGGLGSALGSAAMLAARHFGISAGTNDFVRFFFSGPRLYPTLGPAHVIAAILIVLAVSAASTLYPALIAMRISPVRAMQTEE